jgi:glycosyltransferase involved in cell wall biosynthesis
MLTRPGLFRLAPCRPAFFEPDWYLETYDDVAAVGMDPLRHYLRHGRKEGRLPCFMTAAWRERDLRWGMLDGAEATLETLARAPEPAGPGGRADRVWARLACARHAARRGDWRAAHDWLQPLDPENDLIRGFCLPDPALLAIEAAVLAGDLPQARALLRRARSTFGRLPDLALAEANIAAAETGQGAGWQRVLADMYARARLGGVAASPPDTEAGTGQIAPFDFLHPARPRRRIRRGPLISVIMPALNAEATIGTALRSLRDQSWGNLEILVVDNGSSDRTRAIAQAHAQADSRIRLLDGHAEPGTYAARNLGMAEASGAFLTVLDADDWAHPARIARQVRALQRSPARAASLAHWVRTTPDLRFTRWWREDGLVHPDISSLMLRREVFARLGYWDRTRAAADTEYHQRLLAVCGPDAVIEVLPGLPLSFGRVRSQSLTHHSATGIETHLFGPRRDYALAAQRWHRQLTQTPEALPLPRHPDRRPFPVPSALALPGQPDPAPGPSPAERISGSGIYEDDWYMRSYPDLRARNLDGALHYEDQGEAEGRDPGPGFSSSAYRLAHGPFDGLALTHYVTEGRARGLSPLPVFDGALAAPPPGRHVLIFGHQARERIFGAERSLLGLLERAAEAGFTPSVVIPQILNTDYLAALQSRAYQVHVLPYGWLFGGVAPHPATLERLTALIRDSAAVEVHQNTLVLDAPLRAARAAGVPCVVHAHELPAEDPRLCMDLGLTAAELRTHLLAHADRFTANSRAVLDWLDLPPDRAVLLPNRVDAALAQLPFAPADPVRVALIGSLVAKKGIADFADVARRADRAGLAAEFLLIGPATADLGRLGRLPGNMRHAGYAADPAQAIAQADIVLSLSRVAESFGLTVLEAMTAGRPVICYDRGTPPKLLGDAGAGCVVPADDPAAVFAALAGLLRDPARLRACSEAARLRATDLSRATQMHSAQAVFGAANG